MGKSSGLEQHRIGHGKWACGFAGVGLVCVCAKERLAGRVATETKKSRSVNKEKDWQWSERTLTIGRANDEDMSIWKTPLKDDILTLGLALAGWLAGWLGGRG